MSDEQLPEQVHEAVDQIMPGVTPAALLDAMEKPDSFAELARGDLYVQMALMRRMATHPEFPTGQRMEYIKQLAKMGKVDTPDKGHDPLAGVPPIIIDMGNGTSVSINAASPPRQEIDITPDYNSDDEIELDAGFGMGGKPSVAVMP